MNLEIVEIFKFHFINSLNAKVVIYRNQFANLHSANQLTGFCMMATLTFNELSELLINKNPWFFNFTRLDRLNSHHIRSEIGDPLKYVEHNMQV